MSAEIETEWVNGIFRERKDSHDTDCANGVHCYCVIYDDHDTGPRSCCECSIGEIRYFIPPHDNTAIGG